MINSYSIEAVDDSGTLIFNSAAGEKAVLIFPSREKAEAFIGNQCNVVELRVVELTPETVEAWAQKVRDYSVQNVIIDPPADGDVKAASHAKLETMLRTILTNESNN